MQEQQRQQAIETSQQQAFARFLRERGEWSFRTFGPGCRTKGITAHIRKELNEIEAAPHDEEEWVDVLLLAFDGATRTLMDKGIDPEIIPSMLLTALYVKHLKNTKRNWPAPGPEDQLTEHIREDGE